MPDTAAGKFARFYTVSQPRKHRRGYTVYRVTARVSGGWNSRTQVFPCAPELAVTVRRAWVKRARLGRASWRSLWVGCMHLHPPPVISTSFATISFVQNEESWNPVSFQHAKTASTCMSSM
uniref:Uncharacterized protein n=1 Tax=Eptatretus burgeri TaxID=7764 RepID=A0A8C4PWY2_EPTBU